MVRGAFEGGVECCRGEGGVMVVYPVCFGREEEEGVYV